MRRQFRLPENDEEFLNILGRPWESIVEAGVRWLLIRDRVLPSGFNVPLVEEAHRVDTGYPDTQLDMVYFFPALARASGAAITAISVQQLDGRAFQRWSRHRQPEYPWRPGQDDLSAHLLLVDHWIEREVAP
jgi:Prokaryotic E2 family E